MLKFHCHILIMPLHGMVLLCMAVWRLRMRLDIDLMINRRTALKYGFFWPGVAGLSAVLPGEDASAAGGPLSRIVRCAIYPSVGIARVGNSPGGYFLGPEVPGVTPVPPGGFKDPQGRILRQAVRFRVYGFDAQDRVVAELNANNAEVHWTAHVANKKAAWYQFDQAFDIPESKNLTSIQRNSTITGSARAGLVIDPGPRSIQGRNVNAGGGFSPYQFSGGHFLGVPVNLGEIRTDAVGRLLVFAGLGQSGSNLPDNPPQDFSNNNNWYDDIADGPVDATVKIGNRVFQAEGAWVASAPPNYAPGLQGVVTLYDVMYEVGLTLLGQDPPSPPSFVRQILPLLKRNVQYQWTNLAVLQQYGWGSGESFLNPTRLAQLANPSPRFEPMRQALFSRFRNPNFATFQPDLLPPCYGDATSLPPTSNRQFQAVLPNQYFWLERWANGEFIPDLSAAANADEPPPNVGNLPLAQQPDALTRAALDEGLGGPFHPGCELTWPVRQPLLYYAPFRIARRSGPEPDYGPVLTQSIALSADGPLAGSGPGDLSRWMALPWQTDTSSCLFAYNEPPDIYLPTFWPARVPNNVLTHKNYQVVANRRNPLAIRAAAFRNRAYWFRTRTLTPQQRSQLRKDFVPNWSKIGIVTPRPGPGDGNFPSQFWVEEGADFFPT